MIPFQLVRRLSHGRFPARLELSMEMEVKSDGTEEVMDGRLEIKAHHWGMMRKAKLMWPRGDRS